MKNSHSLRVAFINNPAVIKKEPYISEAEIKQLLAIEAAKKKLEAEGGNNNK